MFYSGTEGVCVVSPLVNHHLSRGAHFMVGLLVPPVSQSLLKKNGRKQQQMGEEQPSRRGSRPAEAQEVVQEQWREGTSARCSQKLLGNAPAATWRARCCVRILELLQKPLRAHYGS